MIRLKYPVVLASASPRRRELLAALVPEFQVDPAHLDEDALTDPDPFVTAQRLAREKALAVFDRHPDALIIGGDTVVAIENQQLSKPVDVEDACRMLRMLSGKTHQVITGVCLRYPRGMKAFTDQSWVTFFSLSDEQIQAYVSTGETMDKAGAYAAQGEGRSIIERIEGSLTNVIGLPMERLEEALKVL